MGKMCCRLDWIERFACLKLLKNTVCEVAFKYRTSGAWIFAGEGPAPVCSTTPELALLLFAFSFLIGDA